MSPSSKTPARHVLSARRKHSTVRGALSVGNGGVDRGIEPPKVM